MRASGYARAEHDWYREEAWFVRSLMAVEPFPGRSWDPACGGGQIPSLMREQGWECHGSDIADRGCGAEVADFFGTKRRVDNIVSNPPFDLIKPWIAHALASTTGKVAIVARLALLESIDRDDLLGSRPGEHPTPLARVLVSRRRVNMPPASMDIPRRGGTIPFAWFVWRHGHTGPATIERI